MINGKIIALQGRVSLRIKSHDGQFKSVETVVDTGFDGWLSLPPVLIAALGLHWKTQGRGILADGTESKFDLFEGTIRWHARQRRISVVSMSTIPLLGMALLEGSELSMEINEGGSLKIKAIRG